MVDFVHCPHGVPFAAERCIRCEAPPVARGHAAMRALVASVFPTLKWRHHGIGVLQAYVRENVEPEVRVHVWDPRLVRPGIVESGNIHDHRFDLESHIVHGRLFERVFDLEAHPDGEWSSFHIENARSAGEEAGYDGACFLLDDEPRFTGRGRARTHVEGTTYTLPRGVFHDTQVDALAITLCTMHDKRGSARLLVPTGRQPVHAFGAPASPELLAAVCRDAEAALRAAP